MAYQARFLWTLCMSACFCWLHGFKHRELMFFHYISYPWPDLKVLGFLMIWDIVLNAGYNRVYFVIILTYGLTDYILIFYILYPYILISLSLYPYILIFISLYPHSYILIYGLADYKLYITLREFKAQPLLLNCRELFLTISNCL